VGLREEGEVVPTEGVTPHEAARLIAASVGRPVGEPGDRQER
jgi:hypothetical protein